MTTCVICQQREAETGQVCHGDRAGLGSVLADLVDAYDGLSAPQSDESPDALPAGPVRVSAGSAPVSGSREAPVPITMDLVDLTAPARAGQARDTFVPLVQTRQVEVEVRRVDRAVVVHRERQADGEVVERHEVVAVEVEETQVRAERVPVHGGYGQPVMVPAGDQVGDLSVATVLDQWVRDWISYRAQAEHLPVPTVPVLAGWLRDRLDWACRSHPAVDEFAHEVRQLLHRCRAVAGDLPARPEILIGVPCSSAGCDGVLVHQAGDTYWAECGLCGRLWTEDEYRDWTRLVAMQVKVNEACAKMDAIRGGSAA